MKTFIPRLLATSAFLLPCWSWANHVKVNCGPAGFWDSSAQKAEGYYVWLMNDDTVRVQGTSGGNWLELGAFKSSSGRPLAELQLADFRSGDVFEGPNFRMVLDQEFSRPHQKKDRRFFRAGFKAKAQTSKSFEGRVECAFGLK